MQYAKPLNPRRYHLEPLLASRGRTIGWLNGNDEPDSEANIARLSILEASKITPIHYAAAMSTEPALRAWVDSIVAESREDQIERGALIATAHRGPSLLLLGKTGVGKTHQAYGAIRDLSISGVMARWTVTTAADMYGALRPRHGVDSETEFRTYRNANLLLIDDLGAERKPTEFTEEVNFRLINWRYEHHLPTLITSNVTLPELASHLGDRVTSRLAEMCQRIVLAGPDRRRETGTGEAA